MQPYFCLLTRAVTRYPALPCPVRSWPQCSDILAQGLPSVGPADHLEASRCVAEQDWAVYMCAVIIAHGRREGVPRCLQAIFVHVTPAGA
jgi:hypothetical protein